MPWGAAVARTTPRNTHHRPVTHHALTPSPSARPAPRAPLQLPTITAATITAAACHHNTPPATAYGLAATPTPPGLNGSNATPLPIMAVSGPQRASSSSNGRLPVPETARPRRCRCRCRSRRRPQGRPYARSDPECSIRSTPFPQQAFLTCPLLASCCAARHRQNAKCTRPGGAQRPQIFSLGDPRSLFLRHAHATRIPPPPLPIPLHRIPPSHGHLMALQATLYGRQPSSDAPSTHSLVSGPIKAYQPIGVATDRALLAWTASTHTDGVSGQGMQLSQRPRPSSGAPADSRAMFMSPGSSPSSLCAAAQLCRGSQHHLLQIIHRWAATPHISYRPPGDLLA
ncbi:hypothetical protein Purlil1_10756 [Purpureocillium lilacinum]|uniref:Uncharacterized protein n=1 Tax=Purpureocillium lilacinum TaxID=33203 RepID=A0ABR0BMG4_PURLI|nr:hypothetical protein Purlil1_10756 [Purpureocillium lilacinum]